DGWPIKNAPIQHRKSTVIEKAFVFKPKFQTTKTRTKFLIQLKNNSNYEDILLEICRKSLKSSDDHAKTLHYTPYSRSIAIVSPNLIDPIFIPYRKLSELTAENVVACFSKLEQSASTASLLGAPFYFEVNTLSKIVGGANEQSNLIYDSASGLMDNFSPDRKCLFRAISVSVAQLIYQGNVNCRRIVTGIANQTSRKSEYLMLFENLATHFKLHDKNPQDFDILYYAPLIESYLNSLAILSDLGKFRLIVVNSRNIKDVWIYPNSEYNYHPKTNIFLYYNNFHFQSIIEPKKFFNVRNFCTECRISIKDIHAHSSSCKAKCLSCSRQMLNPPCPKNSPPIECSKCTMTFFNDSCFEAHKGQTCKRYAKCKCCGEKHRRSLEHICGWKFCVRCKVTHGPRSCHVRPLKSPKQSPKHRIILYDFETTLGPAMDNGQKHIVNYVNCQFTCQVCLDQDVLRNDCHSCHSLNKSWSVLD
ncbi:hypothetical protein ZOSMA_5828G00010, partial [Zostera marina]